MPMSADYMGKHTANDKWAEIVQENVDKSQTKPSVV